MGMLHLTSDVNKSMESALMPVPLFFAACRMVLQMSPTREYCWWLVIVLGSGYPRSGTGEVYSFLTYVILSRPMVAMDCK